ncbi:MAG: hypothetical protein ACRDUV_18005 [Pseudonocardiaceae bacterium]
MGMTDSTSGSPLAGVLAELGWRPEVLARRANGRIGARGGAGRSGVARRPG